jgi:mRNA-degrading endonuclease toxin of MazEF toxin-antitoxin module
MLIEQGDLLKVSGISFPVIIVSCNFFNTSGKAIVCPVVGTAEKGPLHIAVKTAQLEGIALCEQVRYLDLAARHFSKLGSAHYYDIMDISDAVMGMFDYQQKA